MKGAQRLELCAAELRILLRRQKDLGTVWSNQANLLRVLRAGGWLLLLRRLRRLRRGFGQCCLCLLLLLRPLRLLHLLRLLRNCLLHRRLLRNCLLHRHLLRHLLRHRRLLHLRHLRHLRGKLRVLLHSDAAEL